jgi:tetratricopeptide (TPR) repeat protein
MRWKLKFQPNYLKISLTLLSIAGLIAIETFAASNLNELKSQLDQAPENLKLRQSLAQMYFDEGKFADAADTLRLKAEKLPKESLSLLAQTYEKLNDPINENKFLEQLTANFPQYAPGFVQLGAYLYRTSQIKNDPRISMNCLAAYKAAIEINRTYRPAYDGLIGAYEQYKNYYELRILLEDMLKRFGKAPEILANLCRRNTIDGYFSNARRTCIDAIGSDSKNAENYVYLSLIENNQGNLKRAESLLKKVTAKFPQSEFAHSNYADYLAQQKNLPGAESYFKNATLADKKSYRAQIGLAQTSFELKHYETALAAFREACTLFPHQTYRKLKKAADLLRHRKEKNLEEVYLISMHKCTSNSEESLRTPAVAKEEFRSPFALHSKNKLPESEP